MKDLFESLRQHTIVLKRLVDLGSGVQWCYLGVLGEGEPTVLEIKYRWSSCDGDV